jgi:hypothetical protein
LREAIEAGDLDELIILVNAFCLDAEWDLVEDLARRARAAFEERGRQLWPAAAHADYRLALEAPARWAAATVEPGRGRFAPGPLTEVAASTHTWAELADHLPPGPLRGLVAQERVLRGEDLRAEASLADSELPPVLQPWEPEYPLATYRPEGGEFPAPPLHPGPAVAVEPGAYKAVDDEEARRALLDLAAAWTTESAGTAKAAAVVGDAQAAARALDIGVTSVARLEAPEALALAAWAAASGGAHGRRRGMAAGRFATWWALTVLAGLAEHWPPEPEELGQAVAEMSFFTFADETSPPTGWRLALVVEDPLEELAWAVWAVDRRHDEA